LRASLPSTPLMKRALSLYMMRAPLLLAVLALAVVCVSPLCTSRPPALRRALAGPAAPAPRVVVLSMRLRGGFDVWGEDDESGGEAECMAGGRAGAAEVREAARRAAAAAAAFKKAAAPRAAGGKGASEAGRGDGSPGESGSEPDAERELTSAMARQTISSGKQTEVLDTARDDKPGGGQAEDGDEDEDSEDGGQASGEGEEGDEDHDGYDDVGWGGQEPMLGKDVIGLLDLSDMSENAEWVDHLSSSDPPADDAGRAREAGGGEHEKNDSAGSTRAGQGRLGPGEEGERFGIDQEKMLDDGADIFYPNPKWIRKEFLQKYIEPYLADGRHKGVSFRAKEPRNSHKEPVTALCNRGLLTLVARRGSKARCATSRSSCRQVRAVALQRFVRRVWQCVTYE
jgi:hypothetical protein